VRGDLVLAVNISVFVVKKVLDLLLAVPMGCGFTLQNRGSGFVLDKNHPNALKAGINEYACISLADALYREVNAHTIQLSLLLQLEAAICSLATELWVVLCRFVFKFKNLFITSLLKTVNSPKAMCRYYSIYCVGSLPKLHSMLLVSVSLQQSRTVKAVQLVQQGMLTARFTLRTVFQKRRLQNL
jgi:hypothetical protein